ncbi:unnamed protein product, partial [Hapterophycus canaliculatus]
SVAPTSSAGPRLASGRGRARTLPAWMTAAGETNGAVPGGLQGQPPVGGGAMVGVSQETAGRFSSRPSVGSGAVAGKKYITNKKKDGDVYSCKHYASNTGSFYGGAMDGRGRGPNGTSAMARQSSNESSQFDTAQTSHGQSPRPAPSASASVTGGPKPAASLPKNALPPAGRGVERTRPAWMTAGVTGVPGGLQDQASFGSGPAAARKSRPTGIYSSRPSPSAQSAPQAGQHSSFHESTDRSAISSAAENDAKQSEGSATAGAARSSGHEDKATVVDAQNPAPAPTAESDSAPNRATSGAGFAFQHLEDLEATGPEDWQLSGQLLGPKRGRDEGQSVERPASFVGMTGRIFKTGNAGPGPCVKKKKATVEKSSPPK